MTEIIPNSPNGRQLADAGIALAQQHADATVVAWSERIMGAFESWLMLQDAAFAIEDFRAHIEARHPALVPPSPNAWGAVGRMAVNRGLVRFIGYRPARSAATRNHPVRVFRRGA